MFGARLLFARALPALTAVRLARFSARRLAFLNSPFTDARGASSDSILQTLTFVIISSHKGRRVRLFISLCLATLAASSATRVCLDGWSLVFCLASLRLFDAFDNHFEDYGSALLRPDLYRSRRAAIARSCVTRHDSTGRLAWHCRCRRLTCAPRDKGRTLANNTSLHATPLSMPAVALTVGRLPRARTPHLLGA